jgi:DNA mismatch repair protein MutS
MGEALGFAALDLSTGEFRVTEFSGTDADRRAADELQTVRPRELLFASSLSLFAAPQPSLGGQSNASQANASPVAPRLASPDLAPFVRWSETPLDDWIFAADYAIPLVENHFGVLSLEGFGLAGLRGGSHPALRAPDAAWISRSHRPHRLLRAPQLPDPRRGDRTQS